MRYLATVLAFEAGEHPHQPLYDKEQVDPPEADKSHPYVSAVVTMLRAVLMVMVVAVVVPFMLTGHRQRAHPVGMVD